MQEEQQIPFANDNNGGQQGAPTLPQGYWQVTASPRCETTPDAPRLFGSQRSGRGLLLGRAGRIVTMMQKQGDTAIDLLKMDIEGFDFDIIDNMLTEKIPVRQLCVEFHPWLAPGRKEHCIAGLRKAGYRIIYKRHGDHTFLRA